MAEAPQQLRNATCEATHGAGSGEVLVVRGAGIDALAEHAPAVLAVGTLCRGCAAVVFRDDGTSIPHSAWVALSAQHPPKLPAPKTVEQTEALIKAARYGLK